MGNMAIMRPIPNVALTAAPPGAGGANLLTLDPKEVWVPGNSGNPSVGIDLGRVCAFDSFFITGTFPVGAGYSLSYGNDSSGAGAISGVAAKVMPMVRRSSTAARDLVIFPSTVFARYIFLTILYFNASATGTTCSIGKAQVGRSFVPFWGREYGSGRPVIDTGTADRLLGGGFGIEPGVRKGGYNWTLGDLTDAECVTLFDYVLDSGTTGPIVMAEDTTPPAGPALSSPNGNVTLGGTTWSKVGGTAYVNASLSSDLYYHNRAVAQWTAGNTTTTRSAGISTSPLSSGGQASIDFGFELLPAGAMKYYERGTTASLTGTYAATSAFAISIEDGNVVYAVDGVVKRTTALGAFGGDYAFDAAFSDNGSAIKDIQFSGADGFSESVHYGVLQSIEPYERSFPFVTKWSFKMEEWV